MDRSRDTETKHLNEGKTHAANNSKLFNNLNLFNNAIYEVELAKAAIELNESIIVSFFILQYAKLQMLELYYKLFTEFCDIKKSMNRIWIQRTWTLQRGIQMHRDACSCSKTYCCYDVTTTKQIFRGECLKKRVLEQSGCGSLEKMAAS